jgi:hypothetical protein
LQDFCQNKWIYSSISNAAKSLIILRNILVTRSSLPNQNSLQGASGNFTCVVASSPQVPSTVHVHFGTHHFIANLKECLGDLNGEINLNECRITLDLICLTLPPEEHLLEASTRPCYQRMTSLASQVSYSTTADDTDLDAASTTDASG